MTSRSFLSRGIQAPTLTLVLAGLLGCGGNVNVSSGGDGGGGAGGGTTTGTGGATSTTGTGNTTTGTGGTTTTTITTGPTPVCEGLDHISCLGAYPSCAPVYDDQCCPTCDPMGG